MCSSQLSPSSLFIIICAVAVDEAHSAATASWDPPGHPFNRPKPASTLTAAHPGFGIRGKE
jgi:hypothetical protein